ncbi:MAG: septum site-determining protein MinC [Legionellaceae bacterium]|nr:septum site-determining protein MinC [Legionellaceae bacterium]HCA90170.1 septum site-determining protein MinC [Legionellales bacterium]|tara:strand:+ start:3149 stop:3865 length:717 start_codon:yes stop_codon:yes gene_type:complete
MAVNPLSSQVFKLKGRLYTLTVLQLLDTDLATFNTQLKQTITTAPNLLSNIPIVLDCSLIKDKFDLESFIKSMKTHHLLPVAIQSQNHDICEWAKAQKMPVLNGSANQDKALSQTIETIPPSAHEAAEALSNKLVTAPVRSGQQVTCTAGDLVIVSSVSHGAELLAEGNIHVYGPLRGRALAGISGDKQARIFCQSLEAELLSIAGVYRLNDGINHFNEPCQIYLNHNNHICVEPLSS